MGKEQGTYRITIAAGLKSVVADYLQLIKIRLTTVIVLTAVGSFVIVSGWEASGISLLMLAIGGFCVTAASNALNQVLEKDFDKLMERTKDRPVASGRMTISAATLFAGFMCIAGITFLASFNPLTAFFGMMSLVLYAFVYTPLKRYSPAAIFVGAVAGAMPMLIGAVAWEGAITWFALALFGVQFAWQYPHFWSIGFLGYGDYQKAGYRFIPGNGSDRPSRQIARSGLAFSIGIVALSMALYIFGWASLLASAAVTLLSLLFVVQSARFLKYFEFSSARKLMWCSLVFIPCFLLVLLIDKLI